MLNQGNRTKPCVVLSARVLCPAWGRTCMEAGIAVAAGDQLLSFFLPKSNRGDVNLNIRVGP